MHKPRQEAKWKQSKKESKFDLSCALTRVIDQIDKTSQQQSSICKKLVSDLKINGRQKLKLYKKILDSAQKQNLQKQKDFINKYLKRIFIQQYLIGSTETKSNLANLLKKLVIVTFADITQAGREVQLRDFEFIKSWSEVLDLSFRVFGQRVSKEQFQSCKSILQILNQDILNGKQMIVQNEFKSKWLGTFTQILRTQNLLVRVFQGLIEEQMKSQLIEACRIMIQNVSLLSKQVISQLFLLQVFLNPQQPEPSAQKHLCLIHFYHAQSVVLGKATLKNMVSLIPRLKQTEHKCQLVPLLQQSFIQHYAKLNIQEEREFRSNVFDQVINLFEIGRSTYGYLQTIVRIIIQNGDDWNMEGNFLRKFFVATILLRIVPSQLIIQQWPTIVEDVIVQCGNMSVPYAADCAKVLFEKLYQQNQRNYEKWSAFWIDSYKSKLLGSNQKTSLRGVTQFINPILLKICPQPLLLRDLLAQSEQTPNSNLQLGVISLIRCYKEMGQIQVNQQDQIFQHIKDKMINFGYDKIRNFLLSNDEMIAVQAFELVSCSLKPSELIKPMEMKLCLEFFRYSLKTSLPQYRKNYLAVIKKLLDRLRSIYENNLANNSTQNKTSQKLYFDQFIVFLKQLVSICFKNIYPDAIFQLVNPGLQILGLVQSYFGGRRTQIKKGIFLEATSILKQTSFYEFSNFQNLLSCLQSSYESVRKLSHELLNYFDQIQKKQLLLQLWEKSLKNTNKLAIRSYQYACRILTYISQVYPHILQVQNRYQLVQLNILNYFLTLTRQRYIVFKDEFIKQGSNYYKNLIHGLLTVFSYQLDNLVEQMSNQSTYKLKFASSSQQIKQFLEQFFTELMNMLNFAVQISSSNVSTVVLDTLTQSSQTDKKLKVDCRGHFLNQSPQKANIGTFLQSTALISSMGDDQQGIQNTLVVSFYLLTRQAGLVFQSIGGLLANQNCSEYIPSRNLIRLINTYFYALVNLKHMGSVDRISKGLGKMSKVIFDHQSKELSQLPQILLNKLLNHLKQGSFTTILRRSAGVPFAFCCLLKSQSTKRNKLIQKSVSELLSMSKQNKSNPIQLRIHALNILKKLFQDSDLKGDIDPYVSEAFISSIKGFTSQEWGVRNSSLMLFSTLANRTVGIKPIYNLLQFFIKCPSLLQFIQDQLRSFTEASLNTMYPPLYPIVLLFSRLLPFDLKQKPRIIPQGTMKHIRKQELLSLLPILDKSGLNNNYMGRVMTAKAILPFMQIDQIHEYCVSGIQKLPQYFNLDNNMLHYQLTKYNHLLISYKQICRSSMRTIQISPDILQKLWNFMNGNIQQITCIDCPVVLQCFIKIFHYFFDTFNDTMVQQFGDGYIKVVQKLCTMLRYINNKYVFETQRLILTGDLGHSMMRKQAISFQLDLLIKYANKFQDFKNLAVQFIQFLRSKLQQNKNFFQTSDNQICQFFLQGILQNIRVLGQQQKVQIFKAMTHMLEKLQLNKINSDIIVSKILELRISTEFKSSKNGEQVQFLLKQQKQSNNHFLKIAIFKYLDYVNISEGQLLKLLNQFSNPESLQQLRQCVVEYLQTRQNFNQKLNLVHIRLLEDEQYQIRKQTANILSKQLKTYQYNENVIKGEILKRLSIEDLGQLLAENSDFNIKRKNHEQERIFAYDKPNKFRSDINTILDVITSNSKIYSSNQELSTIFGNSLNQYEKKVNILDIYENNVVLRNQYQFELLLRQMLSCSASICKNEENSQKFSRVSRYHPIFADIYSKIKKLQVK